MKYLSNTNYHLDETELAALNAIFNYLKKNKATVSLEYIDIQQILKIDNIQTKDHTHYSSMLSIIYDELEAQNIITIIKPSPEIFRTTVAIRLTNLGRKIVSSQNNYTSYLSSLKNKESNSKIMETVIRVSTILTAIATVGFFIIELMKLTQK